jgi:oxygen-independent coproporphyrinogen-3 oxidase
VEQDFPARALGLYIHIPWCIARCPYCSFFALPFSKAALEEYHAVLLAHKVLIMPLIDRPLRSVYFGGGTPSLLSSEMITRIIKGIPLSEDAEITLEVNPIQITEQWTRDLKSSPINRISMGIQSMFDDELIYLGRRHRAADIPKKLETLRGHGFENISGDIIYGLPRSSSERLSENLEQYLQLGLSHLSCYLLEIDPEGSLSADIPLIPDDEELEAQYRLIQSRLHRAGFLQYEISNFARPGRESRHNLLYWSGDDFLALGASASGYYGGIRYQNPADLAVYRLQVDSGRALGDEDPAQDAMADYIMMRMRLTAGLNLEEYKARFGKDLSKTRADSIRRMTELGYLILEDGNIRLDRDAFFISNAVIGELL